MNLDNPFETFQRSAFRLEGLPEYRVGEESKAFAKFQETGEIDANFGKDWDGLVAKSVDQGKKMERLRLLSEPMTTYEEFETKAYSKFEDVRFVRRSEYPYKKDFWFFDNKYISDITYTKDGTFIDLNTREATKEDIEMFNYWHAVFKRLPISSKIVH